MREFFLKIASFFYWVGIKIRHALFDAKLLHSESFEIPIICVGNITVGGTGKTPTVEMLVENYSDQYNIAILSRGYGRKTTGYREVQTTDSYLSVGDEPLQMKRKFPNVKVIVCEKRSFAIKRINAEFPEVNLIIMDDGFQHRYVEPLINIIIVDANRPIEKDNLLPYGQLRDTKESLTRAHYFIVTKCPLNMKPIDMSLYKEKLRQKASQEIYFSRMHSMPASPVFAEVEGTVPYGTEVIAMAGLGDNDAFFADLTKRYRVVEKIDLPDHHLYRLSDVVRMEQMLKKHPNAVIMTTEKDAVKLANSTAVPEELRKRLFLERISLCFMGDSRELFMKIDNDIKNRDNGAHVRG